MTEQQKRRALAGLALMLAIGASGLAGAAESGAAKAPAKEPTVGRDVIDRGRYLLTVGNCNDCHTANFPERSGNVPESFDQLLVDADRDLGCGSDACMI